MIAKAEGGTGSAKNSTTCNAIQIKFITDTCFRAIQGNFHTSCSDAVISVTGNKESLGSCQGRNGNTAIHTGSTAVPVSQHCIRTCSCIKTKTDWGSGAIFCTDNSARINQGVHNTIL